MLLFHHTSLGLPSRGVSAAGRNRQRLSLLLSRNHNGIMPPVGQPAFVVVHNRQAADEAGQLSFVEQVRCGRLVASFQVSLRRLNDDQRSLWRQQAREMSKQRPREVADAENQLE